MLSIFISVADNSIDVFLEGTSDVSYCCVVSWIGEVGLVKVNDDWVNHVVYEGSDGYLGDMGESCHGRECCREFVCALNISFCGKFIESDGFSELLWSFFVPSRSGRVGIVWSLCLCVNYWGMRCFGVSSFSNSLITRGIFSKRALRVKFMSYSPNGEKMLVTMMKSCNFI